MEGASAKRHGLLSTPCRSDLSSPRFIPRLNFGPPFARRLHRRNASDDCWRNVACDTQANAESPQIGDVLGPRSKRGRVRAICGVSFLVSGSAVPRAEPACSGSAVRRLSGVAITRAVPVLVSASVVILWTAAGRCAVITSFPQARTTVVG